MSGNVKWMETGKYLVVSLENTKPSLIEKGTALFDDIYKMIQNFDEEGIIKTLFAGKAIPDYTDGNFKVRGEDVYLEGEEKPVNPVISKKIVEFMRKKLPYDPLIKFCQNIKANPSQSSKDELFLFLQHNHMPITPDGCFLAYKTVARKEDGNLVDDYTKRFNNNVGAVVKMKREDVDPDRNVTCSHGLHVASYDYAKNVYGKEVLIEVKVRPQDVISVPCDYSNQKMRTCQYEVVALGNSELKDTLIGHDAIRIKRNLGKRKIQQDKIKTTNSKLEELKKCKGGDTVNFSILSGAQIIELVRGITGVTIGISQKSKQSVIKYAKEILKDHGFKPVYKNQ